MADPVTPPAGTPPATPPGGQPPVTPPANDPGNNPAPAPIIVTQEQFDQRYGEKLTALEKELGLEPGAFKDPASLRERLGKKTPPKPAPTGETLSGTDLKLAKMEALMTVGVPSKQIPLLLQHLNISGKTREEIDASIQSLISVKLLTIEAPANDPGKNQQQPSDAAQGAGNPGLPNNQQQQQKTWTSAEIKQLRLSGSLTDAVMADIKKAAAEGRVKE